MRNKRYSVEHFVGSVQQHEAGMSMADISGKLDIAAQRFYRWKKKYGGRGTRA